MKPNLDSDEIYTPQADAPAEACEDISVPEDPYSIFKLGVVDPEILDMLFIEGRYKQEGPNFGTKTGKGRSDSKSGDRRFL